VAVIEGIAKRRGLRMRGGEADLEKAAKVLLQDYRDGLLGRISLETPMTRSVMLAAERVRHAGAGWGQRTCRRIRKLRSSRHARLADAEFSPRAADRPDRSLLLALNSSSGCPFSCFLAMLKLMLPFTAVRLRLDPLLVRIAEAWIAATVAGWRSPRKARWDVEGIEGLDPRGWYLVNCNHQSWADILVLQHLLTRRIPLLKFFLKQQLIVGAGDGAGLVGTRFSLHASTQ
jgi:hypothetical protein